MKDVFITGPGQAKMTIRELSSYWGAHRNTIAGLVKAGKLVDLKTGATPVFDLYHAEKVNQKWKQRGIKHRNPDSKPVETHPIKSPPIIKSNKSVDSEPVKSPPKLAGASRSNIVMVKEPSYLPQEEPDVFTIDLGVPKTATEAAEHKKVYDALSAKVDLAEKVGKLVPKETEDAAGVLFGRTIRDRMMTIPPNVSGILASTTDEFEIERILDKEIRHAIEGMIK